MDDGREYILATPRVRYSLDGRYISGAWVKDGQPTADYPMIEYARVVEHFTVGVTANTNEIVDRPEAPLRSFA